MVVRLRTFMRQWRGLPVVVAVAATIVAANALAADGTSTDVSPTPFGTPTAAIPDPAQSINAVRGDRMWDWTEQTRSEVLARHGVVATSQPLAAQAGLQILKEGGNAVDAAVATAAMLGVVEPHSAGLGGDMEAIYYSAKDHKLYGLNAAGWAPASHTPAFYHPRACTPCRSTAPTASPCRGPLDGWNRLQQRFGRMNLGQVLQPAIETASQGFGLTERIRGDWKSYGGFYVDMLKKDPESRKLFLRNGHVPPLYSIFRNPDLAHAYELIAKDGPKAFYDGPIGQAIVDRMNQDGADWTMSDLSSFKSEWVNPISTNYKGYDVYEMPPQTQGFATLEMLNIIQVCAPKVGYDLRALGPRSAVFWGILVQAKELAYADLLKYNGDPRFVKIPLKKLISKQYAASLCSQINLHHAPPPLTATAGAGRRCR